MQPTLATTAAMRTGSSVRNRWIGLLGALIVCALGLSSPAAAAFHPADLVLHVDTDSTTLRPDALPGDHRFLEPRTAQVLAVSEREVEGRHVAPTDVAGAGSAALSVRPPSGAALESFTSRETRQARRLALLQAYRC